MKEGMPPELLIIWVGAVFVSILVHELGHALAARFYGAAAHIVLYSFGGLAISHPQPRGVWQRVAISFAGPGAGFLFALLIAVILNATGRAVRVEPALVPFRWEPFEDFNLNFLVGNLMYINCYWGLVNLLPIYPLDGGQISRNLFMHYDLRGGLRKSQWLAVIVAAGIAVYFLEETRQINFMSLMFAFLAYQNYQEMQIWNRRGGW